MFDLLEKLRVTLDRVYGEGKVSLVDASLRWMYHHSKMDGSHGGEVKFFCQLSRCFQMKRQNVVMFPEREVISVHMDSNCLPTQVEWFSPQV